MSEIGILTAATLLTALIALNRWFIGHREEMTPEQRRQEDAEMEKERNLW